MEILCPSLGVQCWARPYRLRFGTRDWRSDQSSVLPMKTMTNRLGSVAAWCCLLIRARVGRRCPKRLLGDDNDNAAARAYNGAAALQNAGLHDRAAQKWTEFISAHSQDERIERAHFYLGICQLRSDKFPQAADTFKKVLNTWPQFAQADVAQYNLALARYEQAISSN